MRQWLTSEMVVASMLVTTFACVGMLSLWAAASRRHWFVRTCLVFALLAPLQLIPAYDLYLTFAIAVVATCSAFAIYRIFRWWRGRKGSSQSTDSRSPTYSLRSTLLITATVALTVAVAANVRIDYGQDWPSWPIWGSVLALASLLTWLAANRRLPRWLRAGLLVAAAIAVGVFFHRWGGMSTFNGQYDWTHITHAWRWYTVGLVAVVILYAGIVLSGLQSSSPVSNQETGPSTISRYRQLRPMLFALFLIAIAFIPATTAWELTHPLPIPEDPIPTPNAIDGIYKIGAKIYASPAYKLNAADPVDCGRLATAVAAQQADFDAIERLVNMPGWIPVRYDILQISEHLDDQINRRAIAHFLDAKSECEFRAKKIDEAIKTQVVMLKFAELLHCGGVGVDFLVTDACEGIALGQIYKSIDLFNKQQCQAMLQALQSADRRRRGIDDVLYREHVWTQRSIGWFGHLLEYIARLAPTSPSSWGNDAVFQNANRRTQTQTRFLILTLAIREYQLDHGALPKDLQQLVPTYLPALPIDPFDPTSQPLRYQVHGTEFSLYSVGPDGDDDSGRPMQDDAGLFDKSKQDGDYTLERAFPPESRDASQSDKPTPAK